MQRLYDSGGHIKIDAVEKALKYAKNHGKLPSVPSFKIDNFVESLEKEIEEHRGKVGDRISKHEMEYLFKELMREHFDNITGSELEVIEQILLDENFKF